MDEIEIRHPLEPTVHTGISTLVGTDSRANRVAAFKEKMKTVPKEYPDAMRPFKVGVYIRYFNQTNYENYIDFHKAELSDMVNSCPAWTLIDFYIDEGSVAPNMESSPEWCRLLNDCMIGKVDLIITQKVSNVSKKVEEMTICARFLASRKPPVGIYFISEDIYTLASYNLRDLHDPDFGPPEGLVHPEDRVLLESGNGDEEA